MNQITFSFLLPFLKWPRPSPLAMRKDLWAGISVGLVLIPQSLAYATLAGMPPVTGLYAALLPAVIGILWGSSPLLAVGPVALTSLLTFASLQPLATPFTQEWVSLAIWLALYAGVIQLLLGSFRLGLIANFVSHPVMAGFINAAALIIIFSQIPQLFGLPTDINAMWPERAAASFRETPFQLLQATFIGAGAIALLFLQRRFFPRMPGVLLICIAGILASMALGLPGRGIEIVGVIPSGFPPFGVIPVLSVEHHLALLPPAIIIALISFTEAMASCRTLARNCENVWNENQELIGQGLAKIASGASGAFPVSGSFSRSALNAYVGATSGWSALYAALCVLACLLWATDYLYYLPRAVLAAIIIVPVIGLINFNVFRTLWRSSRDEGFVAFITFAATLIAVPYLHWGVLVGFVTSLLCFLCKLARPRIIEVGVHSDGTLRDRVHHALSPVAPEVLAVRIDSAIVFITAPLLERFIMVRVQQSAAIRTVLLCCNSINHIDATGVESIRQLSRNLRKMGIDFRLSGVKKQIHEIMQKTGLQDELGEKSLFSTDREAIEVLAVSLNT